MQANEAPTKSWSAGEFLARLSWQAKAAGAAFTLAKIHGAIAGLLILSGERALSRYALTAAGSLLVLTFVFCGWHVIAAGRKRSPHCACCQHEGASSK